MTTATSVAHWLTAQNVSYALSGDVAADLLAPWARPTRALVYVDQALDLTPLDLTPATPDAAALEPVVPDDPFVLRDARLVSSDLVIAHPWRVWSDTVARGNTDAADALRTHLFRGTDRMSERRHITLASTSHAEDAAWLAVADVAAVATDLGMDYRLIGGNSVALLVPRPRSHHPGSRPRDRRCRHGRQL